MLVQWYQRLYTYVGALLVVVLYSTAWEESRAANGYYNGEAASLIWHPNGRGVVSFTRRKWIAPSKSQTWPSFSSHVRFATRYAWQQPLSISLGKTAGTQWSLPHVLTVHGKIKHGLRKCSNRDVSFIGNEKSRPVASHESAFLVVKTWQLSQLVQRMLNLQREPNLRPFASYPFLLSIGMGLLFVFVLLKLFRFCWVARKRESFHCWFVLNTWKGWSNFEGGVRSDATAVL